MEGINVRVTMNGDLARRFRRYLDVSWRDQYGAQNLVIKRAVQEFLDREEQREGKTSDVENVSSASN